MVTACPFVSSYFLESLGRKVSIMVGSIVFIIGSVVQAAAWTSAQLLVGRFVAGMSIGLLSSVIVLYQSELAPASLRGALSTLYQLGITFGILLAAFIDQLLVDREEGWRVVMGIICIPAVMLIIGMIFLPRSPRWLVSKGKRKEALKVLLSIRAEEEAVAEEEEIFQEIERSKKEGEPRWVELFQGRVARLLILGVTLQLLQQLVGMNAFMYFGPKIFSAIGFSKNKFTTITNFVNFLSTFPAVVLADRAGRRQLMLWSSIGMTLSCVVMGIMGLMYVTQVPPNPAIPGDEGKWEVTDASAGWAIAVSVFFFVFNFAFGFGPIVWVYCAEIFPLRYRARSLGVTTVANWVGNFIIAQFTPVLLAGVQFNTFFIFGFFCLMGVFLSAWLPETKGVALEKIQELFDNKAGFKSTAEDRGSCSE
uniref:Hexose transporter 1 n=1 Tax=Zooxanthella nutricula TaxID=1333877 RepID=A0A7S2NMR1_9DINO